jgi:hypothetical protein
MRSFFLSFLLFFCSSGIVLFFVHSVTSAYSIVQFIALLLIALAVLVTLFYHASVPMGMRWVLLGSATLISQLLVAATGSLYSPFLILFHFLVLGINLFFPLSTSVLFVVFTFSVLAGTMISDGATLDVWYSDPAVPLLYSISFLSIIPLAHLLRYKYKFKDTIVMLLTNQIEVEEAIISELNELVFVTDRDGSILAVNDAAEQALYKSKAELLHNQLFTVLLLRDKDGMVVTKENLRLDVLLKEKMPLEMHHLSLLGSSLFAAGQVSMRIRPITNLQSTAEQLSIILSSSVQVSHDMHKHLEEAVARHYAMIEELKRKLRATDADNFSTFVLISKAEKDILTARTVDEHSVSEKKVSVDVASLCKDAATMEEDFAHAFHVSIQFSLPNFGMNDIAPLVTPLFTIDPARFTGPFYTASCEVNHLSIAIQKLLDVAVLLASGEKDPLVHLRVEREGTNALIVSITANAPTVALQHTGDIFVMYYGALAGKTNLGQGSGLEGYLAKTIIDTLHIPLNIFPDVEQNRITFQLRIDKKKGHNQSRESDAYEKAAER